MKTPASSPARDVAIVGCGTAGLAAALYLARAGRRVTIFERFSSPRPLGSGLMLQSTGLAVLAELGLEADMRARGQRISRLLGRRSEDGRRVLDVRYEAMGPGAHGLAVHRAALFDVLFRAVQAESALHIETGVDVAACEPAAGGRMRLADAAGRKYGPFALIVDAAGSRSPLRPGGPPTPLAWGALWASLPFPGAPFADDVLEQRYRAAQRMVGVMPMGVSAPGYPRQAAFFWSLRRDGLEDWRTGGLGRWKAEAQALWPETAPLLAAIDDPEQLTFAAYSHATLGRPFGAGIVHIGDSAHCASPQLGQGANMALLDARALAQALESAEDMADAPARYARSRRRHVRLYQALTWAFTPFYQSDSLLLPFLRDELVGPLSEVAFARRLLARIVAGVVIRP